MTAIVSVDWSYTIEVDDSITCPKCEEDIDMCGDDVDTKYAYVKYADIEHAVVIEYSDWVDYAKIEYLVNNINKINLDDLEHIVENA